jgi:hypothetical protein
MDVIAPPMPAVIAEARVAPATEPGVCALTTARASGVS